MGTRSGDVDPGALVYLLDQARMSPEEISELLNKQSGLLGVSGSSGDMRDLLKKSPGDAHAAEAVELFCYRARKYVGAYAAALGGIDLLAFTGGIGEHAAPVRRKICAGLEFLGIELDPQRNDSNAPLISSHRRPRESARHRNQRRPDDRPARSRRAWLVLTEFPEVAMFVFDPKLSSVVEVSQAPPKEAESPHPGAAFAGAARQNAPLLAGGEFSHRRSDLSSGKSPSPRTAPERAHQAASARTLGNFHGTQLHLRAPQSPDQRKAGSGALYRRPGTRRARPQRKFLPGGDLFGRPSRKSPRILRASGASFANSPLPEEFPAIAVRICPIPFTRAENSATPCCTPSEPPSTIRICSSLA